MQRSVYYPVIDGLRFLAFAFVFFWHFHTIIPSKYLQHVGWIGVELFFLISAFLLTKLLKIEFEQRDFIQVKSFYLRRVLRIWPLYFFYLICITFYSLKVGPHYFYPDRLVGNVFFYDNLLTAAQGYNPNLFSVHLWTISMEEQFYLLLPFAIPWFINENKKRVLLLLGVLFLLMIICRIVAVTTNQEEPFMYVLPIAGDCFIAGIVLGLGIFDRFIARLDSLLCFAGAVLLLGSLYFLPGGFEKGYHQVYIYCIIAAGFSLLLISLLNNPNRILSYLFTNRVVIYLGKISYGLYIYHLLAIYAAGRLCDKMGLDKFSLHLPLSIFLNILAAVLSYELFEKHVLKYKRKFSVVGNG